MAEGLPSGAFKPTVMILWGYKADGAIPIHTRKQSMKAILKTLLVVTAFTQK